MGWIWLSHFVQTLLHKARVALPSTATLLANLVDLWTQLTMTRTSGGTAGDSLPGRKELIGYEPVLPPKGNPDGETFRDSPCCMKGPSRDG
jgi:hypothetical protein